MEVRQSEIQHPRYEPMTCIGADFFVLVCTLPPEVYPSRPLLSIPADVLMVMVVLRIRRHIQKMRRMAPKIAPRATQSTIL